MPCRLPITDAPRALIEAGYEPTSYRRIYTAAVNAALPMQKGSNGRWTFDPADLPAIADALGLTDAHAA